jgi:hypothetical protein
MALHVRYRILFVAMMLCMTVQVLFSAPSAQATPKFDEYPAEVYRGRNAKVRLDTPDAKNYRTRLREASRQKPNFAGHYVLVTWGCGTQCQYGAVVNVLNGRVTFLPASVCCGDEDDQPFYYRVNSRLIVFAGMLNESELLISAKN